MKGTIFDIRHFSTHDGGGIRTTVFFKGCPLSCVWCQNPEGISVKRRPLYFENRCIKCRTCVNLCENNGFTMEDNSIVLHPDAEENWEQLIYDCPAGAIEMDSKEMEVEEVMKEIRKDIVFYRRSGGVTVSGGEPLMQSGFVAQLLKECQQEGIHTGIETALYVREEAVKEVLPYLNMAFADLKIFDGDKHKEHTGVSNERIKKNIELLLTSELKDHVVIRTPMIPGFTDAKENITQIASWISGIYENVTYEILNYNPLAEAKYHLVDMEYCYKENPKMYTKEQMNQFGRWAKEAGVHNVIIES